MFNTTHPPLLRRFALACLIALGVSLAPAALCAQTQAPDNSAANKKQDRGETADQGKNDAADRQLAAKIRHSVVSDSELSTYAHNVKIIVVGGAVTLKGPVRSDQEKQIIETMATNLAGKDKVTDQITVSSKSKH